MKKDSDVVRDPTTNPNTEQDTHDTTEDIGPPIVKRGRGTEPNAKGYRTVPNPPKVPKKKTTKIMKKTMAMRMTRWRRRRPSTTTTNTNGNANAVRLLHRAQVGR